MPTHTPAHAPERPFASKELSALAEAICHYTGADFADASEVIAINHIAHPISATDALTGRIAPHAGVLIVITDEPSPRLLLTRRSQHLKSHAGEVSLVGGKADDDDADITATALREAHEEVALPADSVRLIGTLPLQLSKSNLLVRPVVGVISPEVAMRLHPSEAEIARLFWLPLAHLVSTPPAPYRFDIDARGRTQHAGIKAGTAIENTATAPMAQLITPAWCYDGEVIWGMTGRILANMLAIGFDQHYEWGYEIVRG